MFGIFTFFFFFLCPAADQTHVYLGLIYLTLYQSISLGKLYDSVKS